jgi:transcriptional antiterminator Rof (Rho-off)
VTTNSDYRPIGCGAYDEIELLAMRRARVALTQVDDTGGRQCLEGNVVDTSVHDGGEFVVLEMAEGRLEVRLDRIVEMRPL